MQKQPSGSTEDAQRTSLAAPSQRARDIALFREYFDYNYYLKAAGLTGLSEERALEHYLTIGWKDGLNPSKYFSTKAYLEINSDVAENGINPLEHYVLFGIHENRSIAPIITYTATIDEVSVHHIKGWCVEEGNPGGEAELEIRINDLFFASVKNSANRPDLHSKGLSDGQGGFDLKLPLVHMEPGAYTVSLITPTGNRIDRQVVHNVERQRITNGLPWRIKPEALKVIVPIYNALEDVRICIERLKAYTPEDIEILLIDDCSPNPEIKKELAKVENDPRFRVIYNENNLGFTRTVNLGMRESNGADVILLNSDARVTPNWIKGMTEAAYSRPQVATVTAMSDRAGAFSAPNIGNENSLPLGVDEIQYARAFRRRSLRLYPEVATGNGFCMYIRRACLNAIGALDEEAFPCGYGEENEFCMRALRAGWVNLMDDSTYVFHDRSKSFGNAKTDLVQAGRKTVNSRYPEYTYLIRGFHTNECILFARFRARQALEDCSKSLGILPRAVFVTATRSGGTPQTNGDLMDAFAGVLDTWLLRCNSNELELYHCHSGQETIMRRHTLLEPLKPITHRSDEYDVVVAKWLDWLDAEIVHLRHIAWHSLSLPRIAKEQGARVFFSFHDYYAVCPSLKLLDENNVFCGGSCTASKGDCAADLWPTHNLPPLKNAWVHEWRKRISEALSYCDAYITTSPSAKENIRKNLPDIPDSKFHVIPHGRDFETFEQLQSLPSGDKRIRILVPGNIDTAKGLDIIMKLLELDTTRTFEFHILGNAPPSVKSSTDSRLVVHGRYQRKEFANRVRNIAPHLGAIFSIWDETFCHTLTEMWSIGLPVAVLDFATLRRRVETSGAGWVLPKDSPEAILTALLAIACNREEMLQRGHNAVRWQTETGSGQSCRMMASSYLDVYRLCPQPDEIPKIAILAPSGNCLTAANASTHIRVWERTHNRLDRKMNYIRMSIDALMDNMRSGRLKGAIIQRTAVPARMVDSMIETARSTNTPYIFEIDDNLLEVPEDKDPDHFYAGYSPYIKKLIENAAVVFVPTEILAGQIRPLNKKVHIIPNQISARLWGGLEFDPPKSASSRLLYMGTKTHNEDLQFVLPAVEKARESHPNLRLALVGVTEDMNFPEWVEIVPIPIVNRNYSHFVPLLRKVAAGAHLAIAPLVDKSFNRYKSELKLLDYCALGLPVLASNFGPYKEFVNKQTPDGIRLLKNDTDTWADAIVNLLNNRAILRKKGMELRTWVFNHHILEKSEPIFDALIGKAFKLLPEEK